MQSETFVMRSPCSGKRGQDIRDELRRCGDCHALSIDDVPQDFVDGADGHVDEFVKTDGVLATRQI